MTEPDSDLSNTCEHCDHSMGQASTYMRGGVESWHCCRCGRVIGRRYVLEPKTLEGHGDFHQVFEKRYTETIEAKNV